MNLVLPAFSCLMLIVLVVYMKRHDNRREQDQKVYRETMEAMGEQYKKSSLLYRDTLDRMVKIEREKVIELEKLRQCEQRKVEQGYRLNRNLERIK